MSSPSDSSVPLITGLDLDDAMTRMDLTWDEMKELLEIFPASVREEVAKLRAVHPGDADGLRFAAHTLSGIAGNYGAKKLWIAAKALETAAREGRLDDAPALLEEVVVLSDTVCTGVEQALHA